MPNVKNFALNKPALQSSTSEWSLAPDPAHDARNANNGHITTDRCFHTDLEFAPWWQVDLEGTILIRQVAIYNRRHRADRLTHFSILTSLDGVNWHICFRKNDGVVFGDKNDLPYIAEILDGCPARYVRIRLAGYGCLHFRECEIFGVELGEEEAADASVQELERRNRRNFRRSDREGDLIEVADFMVFADVTNYGPNILSSLRSGSYEARERSLVSAAVKAGDRVIEVGGAIGVVSMMAASIVGAEAVVTFDANPRIVSDARDNFFRNGFEHIQTEVGILKNRKTIGRERTLGIWQPQANFFIAREFWASRLNAGSTDQDIIEIVQVPVFCLEDEIERHAADVLICDIEGGEADLLTEADLSCLKTIIMETHYWSAGEKAIDRMVRNIITKGFDLHLGHSGGHVLLFRRSSEE